MATTEPTTNLIKLLSRVLRRQRLIVFGAGCVLTLAAGLAAWILLSLIAGVMIVPVWLKITLMAAAAIATGFAFGKYAVGKMFDGSVDSVAVALEQKHPSLKGRLVAAIQFSRLSAKHGYSTELVNATQEQAVSEIRGIDVGEVVDFNPVWKNARLLAGSLVLAVLMIVVSPGLFRYAFEVYSQPTTKVAPPVAYSVIAFPESGEWVKYKDVKIGGALVGERFPDEAVVHHRLAGGSWQESPINLESLPVQTVASGDSVYFALTLRQVKRSFDFYIEAGEIETPVHSIDVVDRPRVTGIKLSIFSPDYSGLDPLSIDENNGSFSALVGSRVNIALETNLPMDQADLIFEDSSRLPLRIQNNVAEGNLIIENSKSYRVELRDHLGETNPDPIQYYITAVPDEYPSVDVIRPGFNVNLNEEMLLPLLVRIYDDYGFSSLVMKYVVVSQGRPSDENVAVLHFPESIQTEGDVEFNWDMESLNLFPGDHVVYFFEVSDNDRITGPKTSKSRTFIARLPSLDELIAQTEEESLQRIDKTENLLDQGKELVERLKQAARKLESEPPSGQKADWQQQKELESIAEKNAQLQDQVEKMAEDMDKSLDEMRDNALMNREIMEKLQQIQKLFEEVATEDMKEARKKLLESLKNMNREDMQQAMEDFQLSQEDLLERLNRTLDLLKKMQVVQKMEMMLRQVEQLAERQESMNEQTEQQSDDQLPSLSKPESQIKSALEDLKKEVGPLREQMKDAEMADNEAAQKFADALEKTNADVDMEEMAQSLSEKQKSPAKEQGKKAHTKLMSMLNDMQQQMAKMTGEDDAEMRLAMRKAIDHAMHMSQDQESLLREAKSLAAQSAVQRELARQQQDLAEACTGLQQMIKDISSASPFMASDASALVNSAIQNMGMAKGELSEKRGSAGQRYQREAMSHLNQAANRLMEAMNQQSQCQNPSSQCNNPMMKLEQLTQKQNQCNNKTQGQCSNPKPGQSGNPSQQLGGNEGESLRKLAGEQGAIRKSLEQLADEFGGSRQILGRLNNIADEMKEVEEALSSGEVGQETVERQLKIYSRMLEATRSLQRKDFTDQRQATAAENAPVFIPPSLNSELLNDRVNVEDRLRQFLGDNYPPQYEEQIRAYFRALLKAAEQQNGAVSPVEN